MNAFGGGYYALSGAKDVPLEWLSESPFDSYFIPGLFLFFVIGPSCLAASVLLFVKSRFSKKAAIVCGVLLLLWIIIQVAIIGYVSWMQPAIAISGIAILLLSRNLENKQLTNS